MIIAKNGKPRTRLVALAEEKPPAGERPLGLYAGKVWISDDFDEPWPEDIRRALEGEKPLDPTDASPP